MKYIINHAIFGCQSNHVFCPPEGTNLWLKKLYFWDVDLGHRLVIKPTLLILGIISTNCFEQDIFTTLLYY
jgi:hypothetical protein